MGYTWGVHEHFIDRVTKSLLAGQVPEKQMESSKTDNSVNDPILGPTVDVVYELKMPFIVKTEKPPQEDDDDELLFIEETPAPQPVKQSVLNITVKYEPENAFNTQSQKTQDCSPVFSGGQASAKGDAATSDNNATTGDAGNKQDAGEKQDAGNEVEEKPVEDGSKSEEMQSTDSGNKADDEKPEDDGNKGDGDQIVDVESCSQVSKRAADDASTEPVKKKRVRQRQHPDPDPPELRRLRARKNPKMTVTMQTCVNNAYKLKKTFLRVRL